MNDSDFSEIYNKLSYPMKKRTDKIIDLKKTITVKDHEGGRFSLAAILSAVYIGLFYRYFIILPPISSVVNFFTDSLSVFGVERITIAPFNILAAIINYIVLAIFIITILLAYNAFNTKRKLEAEYEKTCRLIKENIEIDFCNCNIPCNCKDKYFEYMHKNKDINLIF